MRYDEGPTAEATVIIDAPVARVWQLVTDINLPAEFSERVPRPRPGSATVPQSGARFVGRNWHKAMGEWETVSIVNRFDPMRLFGWCVTDVDEPSSTWWFELDEQPDGVHLCQRARGPGAVGAEHRDHRHAGEGGTHHRGSPAREHGEHAGHPRRHQEPRRASTVTLRVGVVATRTATTPSSSSARPSSSASIRCRCDFWAGDALTPLAFLAGATSRIRLATGIVQLGARTPRCSRCRALAAGTLGGRFVLGVGTSGPQVMEGWHGVRSTSPCNAHATIEIIRAITAGERLEYHGQIYELPLPDGEGRSIRSL